MTKSKNIRVAALAPYPVFPVKTGGQKCIFLFYKYLSAILPVTVISTVDNVQPFDSKINFAPLLPAAKLRYGNIFLFFKFKTFLKEKEISHFIIEHCYFGWLGAWLKKSVGLHFTVHSHNIESMRFQSLGKWWWKILWYYERWVCRQADCNFFITKEDLDYAVKNYRLKKESCHVVTYGTELDASPAREEKLNCRHALEAKHQIAPLDKILLFNGSLDYLPNTEALKFIIEELNPLLLNAKNFNYKIIICGKGLPESFQNLLEFSEKHIIYAGFVEDISIYFLGADIFINPVEEGGGIKTKLVEALACNEKVISTASGAIGIPQNLSGDNLIVVEHQAEAFYEALMNATIENEIPSEFYEFFYWGKVADKAAEILKSSN